MDTNNPLLFQDQLEKVMGEIRLLRSRGASVNTTLGKMYRFPRLHDDYGILITDLSPAMKMRRLFGS